MVLAKFCFGKAHRTPETKLGEIELARFVRLLDLQCGHIKPALCRLPYENVRFKRRHLIVTFETLTENRATDRSDVRCQTKRLSH